MSSSPMAELFYPAAYALAESPVWDSGNGRLVFVDITAGNIHRIDVSHPAAADTAGQGGWVSAVCMADDGRLLIAGSRGLGLLDLAGDRFDVIVPPDAHMLDHRYNDGKCDRAGAFLVGTMRLTQPREPTGLLYRVTGSSRATLAGGLRVPNAICFSPDGRRLYACDTVDGTLWSFEYDAGRGAIGDRRDLAPVSVAPGKPDGATVDADGCIWSARYNGGAVARITPDGRLDRLIRLPVAQVTSCAFGGSRLATLFITTARQNLDPAGLAAQPLAGSVFAVDPGVSGLPETPFVTNGRRFGEERCPT